LPSELQPLEAEIKAALRGQIDRGHVSVSARWTERPRAKTEIAVDVDRARAVVAALAELKAALELPGEVDVGFVARQPDVVMYADTQANAPDPAAVLAVLSEALEAAVAMRRAEGVALAEDLRLRLDALNEYLAEVETRAPERLIAERDRLRDALQVLLDKQHVDEDRIAQEIAVLAEKLDIAEEIVRLRSHIALFRSSLDGKGPVGKQLAFLGQEMLREVNTIGSKANDTTIAHAVIAMKGELERIREQVENVE
jgi:uncharacterized protein (TIGR00255 family)